MEEIKWSKKVSNEEVLDLIGEKSFLNDNWMGYKYSQNKIVLFIMSLND